MRAITTFEKEYVLAILEKSPIPRAELCKITGIEDRKMRRIIEMLRKDGKHIIHNGKVYELTEDVEKIEKFIRSEDSRTTSIYFSTLAMRQFVAETKGEKIVNVRQHFRRLGVAVEEGQERMEGV